MNGDNERPGNDLKAHLEAVTSIAGTFNAQLDAKAQRDGEALAIIRGWNWDGFCLGNSGVYEIGPINRSLSDTVNELAYSGDPRASDSALSLLSSGKLTATGHYRWRRFLGEHNQNDGQGVIPVRRLQVLQEGLAMPRDRFGSLPKVNLNAMSFVYSESGEYPVAEWDWGNSRFSSATATGDLFENDHCEEWFSAWKIEIFPPKHDDVPVALTTLSAPSVETNGGGRPTALDWEAAALEMAGRYYRGDLKPKSIADVTRAIQEWADGAHGGPSDSTVRPHANRIFEDFNTWETD